MSVPLSELSSRFTEDILVIFMHVPHTYLEKYHSILSTLFFTSHMLQIC